MREHLKNLFIANTMTKMYHFFQSPIGSSIVILAMVILSVFQHAPIETTLVDRIYYLVIKNYDLYHNHISFPQEVLKFPVFNFHYLLLNFQKFTKLDFDTLLIYIYFVSAIIGAFIVYQISKIFLSDNVLRFYPVFLWLFDVKLLYPIFHLSTLSDEIRHYNFGLPVLLVAIYFFLKRKDTYSLIIWASLMWFSQSSFLIGIPLFVAVFMRGIKEKNMRDILNILPAIGLILLYLLTHTDLFGNRLNEDWYLLTLMSGSPNYESLTFNQLKTFLFLSLFVITIITFSIWHREYKTKSELLPSTESLCLLVFSAVGVFVSYIFIVDVLKIYYYFIGYQFLKVYWNINFGSIFIFLIYITRHATERMMLLSSLLLIPASTFPSIEIFYTLFIINFIFCKHFKNNSLIELLNYGLLITAIVTIIDSNIEKLIFLAVFFLISFVSVKFLNKHEHENRINYFEFLLIAVILAIILTGIKKFAVLLMLFLVCLIVIKYMQNRSYVFSTKYYTVFIIIMLYSLTTVLSSVNQYFNYPTPPLTQRKLAEKDYIEACLFVNELTFNKGESIIVPYTGWPMETYLLLSNKPMIPMYNPEGVLLMGYNSEVWKQIQLDFFGDDFFKGLSVDHLKESLDKLEIRRQIAWLKLDLERIQFLKRKYGAKYIIRENVLPINAKSLFRNHKYTVYEL